MDRELLCWYSFKDGHHTCILLADHDGPHEPMPDEDIVIRLAWGYSGVTEDADG